MALTIESSFDVRASLADTWRVLTDIERSAPCFPGAELKSRNEDGSWQGTLNVKLGPLSFRFAGAFGFAALDEPAGHAVISASGTDVKGRGGATSRMDVQLASAGASTHVKVTAHVDLTGLVAQYGRGAGMIEALSQQLVNQFAANLQKTMGRQPADTEAAGPASAVEGAPAGSAPTSTAVPLNAGNLIWRALIHALCRRFRRLSARRDG